MNSVEERKQKLMSYMGVSPQNSPDEGTGGEAPQETDKYKALEYTSYKDMLSSKIQASAAKEQAQKYIGNTLSASGFKGQGIAESTNVGIQNSYQNAINAADQAHSANMVDIATQKAEDAEVANQERWQSAMTLIQQAQSQEDLDYVKNNFYEGMSDDQKKMFDYYYASYSNSFDKSNQFKTFASQADEIKSTAFELNDAGEITGVKNDVAAARYNSLVMQEKGYYVQGLGNGKQNDDVDITVGQSSRDSNNEYDLKCGSAVSSGMTVNLNNAVGSDNPANGTLVIYGGKLYVSGKNGWREVVSDRSNVDDAIKAFKKLGIYIA